MISERGKGRQGDTVLDYVHVVYSFPLPPYSFGFVWRFPLDIVFCCTRLCFSAIFILSHCMEAIAISVVLLSSILLIRRPHDCIIQIRISTSRSWILASHLASPLHFKRTRYHDPHSINSLSFRSYVRINFGTKSTCDWNGVLAMRSQNTPTELHEWKKSVLKYIN